MLSRPVRCIVTRGCYQLSWLCKTNQSLCRLCTRAHRLVGCRACRCRIDRLFCLLWLKPRHVMRSSLWSYSLSGLEHLIWIQNWDEDTITENWYIYERKVMYLFGKWCKLVKEIKAWIHNKGRNMINLTITSFFLSKSYHHLYILYILLLAKLSKRKASKKYHMR